MNYLYIQHVQVGWKKKRDKLGQGERERERQTGAGRERDWGRLVDK